MSAFLKPDDGQGPMGGMRMCEKARHGGVSVTTQAARDRRHVELVVTIADRQDREAFSELFTTFAPKVKSYMMQGGVCAEQAEDLTIEAFVKLWRSTSTFDPATTSLAAWIFTIARNTRIDHWRREPRAEPGLLGLDRSATALASPTFQ